MPAQNVILLLNVGYMAIYNYMANVLSQNSALVCKAPSLMCRSRLVAEARGIVLGSGVLYLV